MRWPYSPTIGSIQPGGGRDGPVRLGVKRTRTLGFLAGLATGAAIWLLSPLISGRREPWDSGGFYYPGALLLAGLLGGLLLSENSRSFAAGIFVGQVLVLLGGVLVEPSSGGLWPLGVVFLALYSLLALLGTALGSGWRRSRTGQNP